MKKKMIGILVCMLLLSTIYSTTAAQIISNEDKKDIKRDIILLENSPPTDPIIKCPDIVKKNRIFFVRAISTDPDNDQIFYRLKMEEDDKPSHWHGPYDSGVGFITGVGIFQYVGEITIYFQTRDVNFAESGWSNHTITLTNSKSKTQMLSITNILNNFPNILSVLRLIL